MFGYLMAATRPGVSDLAEISFALRRRDVAFLETLVERYQYRLTRYLIYLLGRREGVDDLVQETWLRVLERGATYDGRSRFEPWLFTIARNLAFDEARRRRPTVSFDAGDTPHHGTGSSGVSAEASATISNAPSPFLLAARSEDANRLAHSLDTLDPLSREALVLRFQEDLSLAEIAALSGAPVSTVASRIYRALAVMRSQLKERTA